MLIDKRLRIFLILVVIVAVLCGLYICYERILVERKDNTVELAMDYSDVVKISKLDGIPIPHILKTLKGIGIQSIALPEDTLDSAEERGELSWMSGSVIISAKRITNASAPLFTTLIKRKDIDPFRYYIVFKNKDMLERVMYELKLALGESNVKRLSNKVLEVSDDEEDLAFLGIGVDPNIYFYLKKIGFKVIPRLKNSFRLTGDKISRKLNLQKIMNDDDVIIFDEESILGYPFSIASTAKELKGRGIRFGFIEFSEQLGDRSLARMMGEGIVRVHSITEEEMEITPLKTAIERWQRAVRERGVRILYIRPYLYSFTQKSISDTNVTYIDKIKDRLKQVGFNFGYAKELKRIDLRLWQIVLLAFGVCASLLLLFSFFFRVPIELVVSFIVITLFSVLISRYLGNLIFARKVLALSAAIIFPSLSVIYAFSDKSLSEARSRVLKSISKVIIIALVTISGGIIISGLLSTTRFMLGADLFSGVKLAFVLPIFIVAAYFFFGGEQEEQLTLKGITEKILNFLNIKISMLHVVLGVFSLIFVAIFILRSGNFGIPVPMIEREVRDILEKLLVVRPRTKEFLIGYPILVLSVVYYSWIKNWLWFVLALGSVAPISLINTFCHIHSPILISCIRSLNGLIFGIIIGLVLSVLFAFSIKFYKFILRT